MGNKIVDRVLSDENIFLSIFTVESYIQNKELLNEQDIRSFNKLKDPFIDNSNFIKRIKEKLKKILNNDEEYFDVSVYFKPKKYDKENGVVFRPLHTARLIDQIAMVSMLQVLVYDVDTEDKLVPSQLSRLIPNDFYGNRISYDGQKLFKPWQEQYQQYISDSNDAMYNCVKTKKYKYEVTLDLIDFFPSINPLVLIKFIQSNIPNDLSDSEIETFDVIVKKLTFFKLEELEKSEIEWYCPNYNKQIKYVKGIPQGLPHSYFFANLFMILVRKEYEKVFPGEMFFYVDDSVIFTNGNKNVMDDLTFENSIELLNLSLKQLNDISNIKCELPKDYNFDVSSESKDFLVEVHKLDEKSSYYKIDDAIENSGELYLHSLSRETSNLGFDIYSSYTSDELIALHNKTEAIMRIIKKELEVQTNDTDSFYFEDGIEKNDQYIKKLIRYNKFFSYRSKKLKFITNEKGFSLIKDLNSIFAEINSKNSENKIESFFKYYNDDILLALINYALNKYYNNQSVFSSIMKNIKKINRLLYGEVLSKSYLNKLYDKKRYTKIYENGRYDRLYDKVKYAFKTDLDTLQKDRFELINKFLDENVHISDMLCKLNLNYMTKYVKYVYQNSNVLVRMILNSVISYLLNYEINDSAVLEKKTNEAILYSEVRILMYLRNNEFDLSTFKTIREIFFKQDYMYQTDYNLLQVLNDFKLFVKDPKRIDNLILVHKYCSDTWKNGSKYLYFYTLHNQEHAISLIKNSIAIIHKISYLKMKSFDYYILFAACYLHDISMVSFPSIEKFYDANNSDANKIYTDFICDIDISDSLKTKKSLCKCYQDIDSYFESDIRSTHAKDSANDIRNYQELSFLNESDREFIARVSEGHGYDTSDIYWTKSNGKDNLINEKTISIILRLSDLLDISRYRVSKLILSHNLKILNNVSRFHWLSHLVTEGYSLKTEYIINPIDMDSTNKKTFLKKDSITEKLILTINVLMSQTTVTHIKNKCKYVQSAVMDGDSLIYTLDTTEKCSNDNCCFLCKWFSIKNEYLIQELAVLKKYLNLVVDNHFNFDVSIVVNPVEKTNITNEEFDYLKQYLESK